MRLTSPDSNHEHFYSRWEDGLNIYRNTAPGVFRLKKCFNLHRPHLFSKDLRTTLFLLNLGVPKSLIHKREKYMDLGFQWLQLCSRSKAFYNYSDSNFTHSALITMLWSIGKISLSQINQLTQSNTETDYRHTLEIGFKLSKSSAIQLANFIDQLQIEDDCNILYEFLELILKKQIALKDLHVTRKINSTSLGIIVDALNRGFKPVVYCQIVNHYPRALSLINAELDLLFYDYFTEHHLGICSSEEDLILLIKLAIHINKLCDHQSEWSTGQDYYLERWQNIDSIPNALALTQQLSRDRAVRLTQTFPYYSLFIHIEDKPKFITLTGYKHRRFVVSSFTSGLRFFHEARPSVLIEKQIKPYTVLSRSIESFFKNNGNPLDIPRDHFEKSIDFGKFSISWLQLCSELPDFYSFSKDHPVLAYLLLRLHLENRIMMVSMINCLKSAAPAKHVYSRFIGATAIHNLELLKSLEFDLRESYETEDLIGFLKIDLSCIQFSKTQPFGSLTMMVLRPYFESPIIMNKIIAVLEYINAKSERNYFSAESKLIVLNYLITIHPGSLLNTATGKDIDVVLEILDKINDSNSIELYNWWQTKPDYPEMELILKKFRLKQNKMRA